MPVLFIIVGAEGVVEANIGTMPTDDLPGVRLATEAERGAFNAGLEPLAREKGCDVRDFYIDGTGRPYWLVAIEETACEEARRVAIRYRRVRRLFN
jgi:hypothetical protein